MRLFSFAGTSGLILLIAMTPAVAQTSSSKASPKSPPAKIAPAPASVQPLFSPIPSAKTPDQCRADCAKTYYFCLAENEQSECAPQWSQCRITCNTPGR